jgi:hypothetical protein
MTGTAPSGELMSYRAAITTQFATYTPLRIPNRLLDLANSRIPEGNLAGWLPQTGRLRQLDELVLPTHCCHALMTGFDKHRAWPKGVLDRRGHLDSCASQWCIAFV